MYAALLNFEEVLDNNLDRTERDRLLAELNNGRTAPEPHIVALAEQLAVYLQDKSLPLVTYRPGLWARGQRWLRGMGEKLGRKNRRRLIIGLLVLGSAAALLVAVLLVAAWLAVVAPDANMPTLQVTIDEPTAAQPIWLGVRLILQVLVSLLYLVALVRFWRGHEQEAINTALFAALLAFTLVNLLNFYVSQFGALAAFFANLVTILVLLAYRTWSLAPQGEDAL